MFNFKNSYVSIIISIFGWISFILWVLIFHPSFNFFNLPFGSGSIFTYYVLMFLSLNIFLLGMLLFLNYYFKPTDKIIIKNKLLGAFFKAGFFLSYTPLIILICSIFIVFLTAS